MGRRSSRPARGAGFTREFGGGSSEVRLRGISVRRNFGQEWDCREVCVPCRMARFGASARGRRVREVPDPRSRWRFDGRSRRVRGMSPPRSLGGRAPRAQFFRARTRGVRRSPGSFVSCRQARVSEARRGAVGTGTVIAAPTVGETIQDEHRTPITEHLIRRDRERNEPAPNRRAVSLTMERE